MATILISENVTLDGVMQDPTGEEGSARGGWFARISDGDRAAWAQAAFAEAQEASAWLVGRRSYEYFTARWPERTGAFAQRLRELPKYVVSSSPVDTGWGPTTVIALDDVLALKERLAGEIAVPASRTLVHALLERGLVDAVRLTVFPSVAGSGDRLFAAPGGAPPSRGPHARRGPRRAALRRAQHLTLVS